MKKRGRKEDDRARERRIVHGPGSDSSQERPQQPNQTVTRAAPFSGDEVDEQDTESQNPELESEGREDPARPFLLRDTANTVVTNSSWLHSSSRTVASRNTVVTNSSWSLSSTLSVASRFGTMTIYDTAPSRSGQQERPEEIVYRNVERRGRRGPDALPYGGPPEGLPNPSGPSALRQGPLSWRWPASHHPLGVQRRTAGLSNPPRQNQMHPYGMPFPLTQAPVVDGQFDDAEEEIELGFPTQSENWPPAVDGQFDDAEEDIAYWGSATQTESQSMPQAAIIALESQLDGAEMHEQELELSTSTFSTTAD